VFVATRTEYIMTYSVCAIKSKLAFPRFWDGDFEAGAMISLMGPHVQEIFYETVLWVANRGKIDNEFTDRISG
jgi:hypothetical protein